MENQLLYLSGKDFGDLAGDLLGRGSSVSFQANGNSMSPFIRDGDRVTVEPCRGRIEPGDVVLLRTEDGRLLLHRVAEVEGNRVITRGDAALNKDGPVPAERILGKIIRVEGEGLNFHLRKPYKSLISRHFSFNHPVMKSPLLLRLAKRLTHLLG